MDNQTLHIRLTLRPDGGDPHERYEATQDLESDIRRLAVDQPGLDVIEAPDPHQQRSSGAILIEVLPSIISGLFSVVSAYLPSRPSVTVKVRVTTAAGQLVYQGAADEMPETITTTEQGPATPAEAEAQPPSNDIEP
jgi:hypothetical protein